MYGWNIEHRQVQHLAWHETLELHEIITYESAQLMALKLNLVCVTNPELKQLFIENIHTMENNLKELLPYYQVAPSVGGTRSEATVDLTAYYSSQLLILTKTLVRNYAVAITESATPALRETLKKQLNQAIQSHYKVFQFLMKHGYYPTYDLAKLLENDQKVASVAINKQI